MSCRALLERSRRRSGSNARRREFRRGLVPEAAVRSMVIILHPPVLDNHFRLLNRVKQLPIQNLIVKSALFAMARYPLDKRSKG